jgi:hypothetical protein
MKRHFTLLAVLMLLFLATAGCIDIHLANDLLVPKKEIEIEYEFFTYNFNHSFSSTPTDPAEIYSEQFELEVKPQTKHMRIDIEVGMRSLKEIWDSIPNGTLKDYLEEFVGRLFELADQRYVEITISKPEGDVIYDKRFNQSIADEIPLISGPMDGIWIIDVEAAGVGLEDLDYNDHFSIDVVLNEIKE